MYANVARSYSVAVETYSEERYNYVTVRPLSVQLRILSIHCSSCSHGMVRFPMRLEENQNGALLSSDHHTAKTMTVQSMGIC